MRSLPRILLVALVILASDRATFAARDAQGAPHGVDVALNASGHLTLPDGSRLAKEYDAAALHVVSARAFLLPSVRALLVVTETRADAAGCDKLLDDQRAQLVKVNDDATARLLTKLDVVEWRTIAGRRALYSEGGTRAEDDARAGKPYAPSAGVLLCRGATLLNLTLSLPSGAIGDAERESLLAIAASARD